VDLVIEWGQVHALLGENGAGKTTLMNVVYGLVRADSGEIVFDGRPAIIHGPTDAIGLGIGMVHQHFMLIPPLTVAENIILGHETVGPAGTVDLQEARQKVSELATRYGLEVDPMARVSDLSVGLQQRVEILKTLYRGARLLIMDEPTAVLTPQEAQGLFDILRSLAKEGKAIIFITHKLGEVIDIADLITVMRHGKVVATTTPGESSPADLARLMVGRPVMLQVDKSPARPGKPVMQLQQLVIDDDRNHVAVEGVDLEIRSGEIVGVAGVEGNGQTELVEALVGLRQPRSGRILLNGRDVTRTGARMFISLGVGHIPADRHRMGIVLEHSIADNLVLSTYDQRPFASGIVRQLAAVLNYARKLIKSFDIRAGSPAQPVGSLSGGNQQKVVAARELGRNPKILIASQPTRGLDVGSIEFIHKQIVTQRDAGLGVLLVSSELDEVLSLSDRVAVMYRGQIVGVLEGKAAEREKIGLMMAGAA
jgi:simple sugar transport system ATP-binding protein